MESVSYSEEPDSNNFQAENSNKFSVIVSKFAYMQMLVWGLDIKNGKNTMLCDMNRTLELLQKDLLCLVKLNYLVLHSSALVHKLSSLKLETTSSKRILYFSDSLIEVSVKEVTYLCLKSMENHSANEKFSHWFCSAIYTLSNTSMVTVYGTLIPKEK